MEKRLLALAEDPGGSGLFHFVSADATALTDLLSAIGGGLADFGLPAIPVPASGAHDAAVAFMAHLALLARTPCADLPREAAQLLSKAVEYQDHAIRICAAQGVATPDLWDGGIIFAAPRGLLHRTLLHSWHLRRRGKRVAVIETMVREQIGHLQSLVLTEMPRDRDIRHSEQQRDRLIRAAEEERDRLIRLEEDARRPLEGRPWPQMDGVDYWLPDAEEKEIALTIRRTTASEGGDTGFVAYATCEFDLEAGQVFMFRLPLDAGTFWDPCFAAIFAANIRARAGATICDVQMDVGTRDGMVFEKPPLASDQTPAHLAIAWRYLEKPQQPYLRVRVILRDRAPSMELDVSGLFVGQHYDPYRHNPAFRGAMRPIQDQSTARILADFEEAAQRAAPSAAFVASQAFIRPFLVMRDGEMRFPMLLGTSNGLDWYGLKPDHGIDFHRDWGVIREGDVVLDCGANVGQMAAYFALVAGPRGKVIAFDPFLQNCMQVQAQADLNAPGRLIAVRKGLGARRETLRVSNIIQMTAEAAAQEDFVTIEIVPLDDYIGENPTMVKLDIEGAEVDALRGAAKLMRQCRPRLFIEVHTPFLGQFGHTLTDFFDAIPGDIYEIRIQVEGRDKDWRVYEPGMETGVTDPMLVYAVPKPDAPH